MSKKKDIIITQYGQSLTRRRMEDKTLTHFTPEEYARNRNYYSISHQSWKSSDLKISVLGILVCSH